MTDIHTGSLLSLLHRVQPESLHFPEEGNLTTSQVARLTLKAIKPHIPRAYKGVFLASCGECVFTFMLCAYILGRKRQQGQLWLFALRSSKYGKFIVPNSIFVLVLGVAGYLLAWAVLLPIGVGIDWKNGSLWDWAWIIPLPWTPLVLGAFYSVWGLILSCSPLSPISDVRVKSKQKIYLPVCCRPWLMNSIAVILPALFVVVNLTLTIFAGQKHYQMIALEDTILPRGQLQRLMADSSLELASPELVVKCKILWAAYAEVWRFGCLSLTVFAMCAFATCIPCYAYGIPNLMFLIQYAFDMSPHKSILGSEKTPRENTWKQICFLLTVGRPQKQQPNEIMTGVSLPLTELYRNHDHYFLTTWRLTLLCLGHVTILCLCIPLFALLPVFLITVAWPAMVVKGNIGPSALASLVACSVVTILSCTHVALCCTIATFDPVFRAIVGLRPGSHQHTILLTSTTSGTDAEELAGSIGKQMESNVRLTTRSQREEVIFQTRNVQYYPDLPTIRISKVPYFAGTSRPEPLATLSVASEEPLRSSESGIRDPVRSTQPHQSFLELDAN